MNQLDGEWSVLDLPKGFGISMKLEIKYNSLFFYTIFLLFLSNIGYFLTKLRIKKNNT